MSGWSQKKEIGKREQRKEKEKKRAVEQFVLHLCPDKDARASMGEVETTKSGQAWTIFPEPPPRRLASVQTDPHSRKQQDIMPQGGAEKS